MFNNKNPASGYALDPKTFDYLVSTPTYNRITSSTSPDYVIADGVTTKGARLQVDGTIEAQGRDILKELDELRESMLLLTRDLKLEEQYPELKQAYDDYMELYRSIKIADKLAKTGNT